MSTNFFQDQEFDNSFFDSSSFVSDEDKIQNDFFRGTPIEVSRFLPINFYSSLFSQNHQFAKDPMFSSFRNGFVPVPADSFLFKWHHHPEFRKLVEKQTSLKVDVVKEEFAFDPKDFRPVRACKMICVFPVTIDFDFAVKNASAKLFYNRIRPHHKIRFGQSNGFFRTEFTVYEFRSGN